MSNKALELLVNTETSLAAGENTIILNTQAAALSSMSSFLRDYRGRADMAEMLLAQSEESFVKNIEILRNQIFSGEITAAQSTAQKIVAQSDLERAELSVETVRILLFTNEIEAALKEAEHALKFSALPNLSRLTCHQLRGHCFILQGLFEQAIGELKKATALGELYPQAGAAFSAEAFLVIALCNTHRLEEAKESLSSLQSRVKCIKQEELWIDRLLTLARTEAHFYRSIGSAKEELSALQTAKCIAKWIGDSITLDKCQNEMVTVLKTHPNLEKFSSVFSFSGWTFVPDQDLILTHFPKQVTRLQKKPIIKRILELLCERSMTSEELFEKIWAASYHPEKHGVNIRVNISNTRQVLPDGALVVLDGLITLL